MTAQAELQGDKVNIHAEIAGELMVSYSSNSHAIYYITAEPQLDGKEIIGVGEGSLFDGDGVETKVSLKQKFSLDEPKEIPQPLAKQEFRILTEDGILVGLTYRQRIHSVCEPDNVFSRLCEGEQRN
ncbi:hypothetical protein CTI14_14775 [Methylobacterium radiotolerans]|jgi:hypothetical protein|nr:hypothetical protein CTI14_14775 [Methylobacterium radiotolerans]